MLKLLPYNAEDFTKGITLGDAYNVRVTHEINGSHMLEFTNPINNKSEMIEENKIVVCEGQAYRIIRVARNKGGEAVLEAECHHVYNADAPNIHLQNVPDMMGVSPSNILAKVFSGSKFTLISDSKLSELGMKRVDYDGFLIDFFSTDKTNPFDVVRAVIESCGKGEIYSDNYSIALVEKIGHNNNMRLDLTKNMHNISVERDITDMVTRLYPYGKDDAHIGSVNGGVQYIQSANAGVYGVREGYRDYSDYMEPDKIKRRALWEFDSANEERIDVPSINITGTFADISKLEESGSSEHLELGDEVVVIDSGNEIRERVIKLEYYPYQNDGTIISIGRVKRDLFFYLEQMGTLTRRYSKISTETGKVKAQAVAGVISNSGVRLTSDSGDLSILSDLLKISNGSITKVQIGNMNSKFICKIRDNAGNIAIDTGADGKMDFKGDLTAEKIIIGTNTITKNEAGYLCINGKKILTE